MKKLFCEVLNALKNSLFTANSSAAVYSPILDDKVYL